MRKSDGLMAILHITKMIIRKNYLYAAFAVAAFMLSSCKDNDEPEIPGSSLEAKSYTTETLAFTIDGRTAEKPE